MNIEIKKTVKAGNSSAVILPRAWLNKEVRVELVKKTPEIILQDVINITKRYIELEEIIGIYLVGSYARHEESKDSDIDILIISRKTDKEMIQDGIYNILIVSEPLLLWKLQNDLLPVGSMIREAKSLINSKYLSQVEVKVTRKNIKWYIKTTEEKLGLVKKVLETVKDTIDKRVIYTLVLRIRTIYTIQNLIQNKEYSKREFIKLIDEISGSNNVYLVYLAVKNNSKDDKKYSITKEEAEKLYNYLKEQQNNIKNLLI